MKAILLAGGKGTRLRPLTIHTPKPIVPIFDRAFLHYQIDLLKQVPEIDEVILSLNYQPRRIEEVFGEGEGTGVRIRYVVEPAPLGTGGAIRYASQGITDTIVVFNGDVMTSVDVSAVVERHRERKAQATIVLTPVDNPSAYGLVETDADGRVTRFLEKPKPDEITCDTINAGIYVLEPDDLRSHPEGRLLLDRARLLPVARPSAARPFVAYIDRGYWIDIGTPEKYVQVHRDMFDGRFSAGLYRGHRPQPADGVARGADRRRRHDHGPCFIDAGAHMKTGRGGRPVRRARPRRDRRRRRAVSRTPSSGRTRGSARTRSSTARSLGRNCHIGRNVSSPAPPCIGDKTTLTDYTHL